MIKINQGSAIDALLPIANGENSAFDLNNGSINTTTSFSELFNDSNQQSELEEGVELSPNLPDFDAEGEKDEAILTQPQERSQNDFSDEMGVANPVHMMQNALKSSQAVAEQRDEFPVSSQLNALPNENNPSNSEYSEVDASPRSSSEQQSTGDKYSEDDFSDNPKEDTKALTRASTEQIGKTEVQNKAYVREVSTTLNNIYQSINSGIEEFQSSNSINGSITIRIKPSTLGEIVITLEQPDPAKGQERTGANLVDARIYTSNPEIANYLNLIRRDIYSQGMVRTLSIQSGTTNKDNNKESAVYDQAADHNLEQGSDNNKNPFFFNGQENEGRYVY